MGSDVSRRIGLASGVFTSLRAVWKHATLSRGQKLLFFQSFVISRLLYGLASTWLVKAQLRRLDGFYARCLRNILGIPTAYVSRVSNQAVFSRARVKPISEQLQGMQLALLSKAAHAPTGALIRKNVFMEQSLRPVVGYYIRRVGRPRQDWTTSLLAVGATLYKSKQTFEKRLMERSPKSWKVV